jgi:hypothetical protein
MPLECLLRGQNATSAHDLRMTALASTPDISTSGEKMT